MGAEKILENKTIPGWAKGILVVVATGAAAFAAFKIYKHVKKMADKQDVKETVKEANQELVALSKSEKPSYADSQYKAWANQIETMLTGCDAHTNDASIAKIFMNVRNASDHLKLIRAFGTREIKGCGFVSDYQADLPTVIKKELLENMIDTINKWYIARKLKYRF